MFAMWSSYILSDISTEKCTDLAVHCRTPNGHLNKDQNECSWSDAYVTCNATADGFTGCLCVLPVEANVASGCEPEAETRSGIYRRLKWLQITLC